MPGLQVFAKPLKIILRARKLILGPESLEKDKPMKKFQFSQLSSSGQFSVKMKEAETDIPGLQSKMSQPTDGSLFQSIKTSCCQGSCRQ